MRSIFLVLIMACFITACNTGKKFTSRKYTSGRYVSFPSHKQKVRKTPSDKESSLAAERSERERSNVQHPETLPDKEITTQAETKPAIKNQQGQEPVILRRRSKLAESLTVKTLAEKMTEEKKKSEAPSNAQPGSGSLISVILSGGGVVMDVAGCALAIIFMEYIFLALCMVGLVLGTVGLVMGIRGIKEYKSEKANGNKNKATLILGIIGTAVGGVAMFLAAYLAIVGAIIVSWGEI